MLLCFVHLNVLGLFCYMIIKTPSVLLNNPKGQIAANFLFNIKRNQGLDLMTQKDSQPVQGLDYTLDNYILFGHMMHLKKINILESGSFV